MSAATLARLRACLPYSSGMARREIKAMIVAIESEIPERATAVDPEPKPPEALHEAAEGAGSSSEAAPAQRQGGVATSRPRMPGDTGKAGCAGGAGGSPAICGRQRKGITYMTPLLSSCNIS